MKIINYNINGTCDECLDKNVKVYHFQPEYGLSYIYLCEKCLKELKDNLNKMFEEDLNAFLKNLGY